MLLFSCYRIYSLLIYKKTRTKDIQYHIIMTDTLNKISTKLNKYFSTQPVVIVYLYGSRAKGKSDKFSDYDIGILFNDKLSKKDRFDLRLKYFSEIARLLRISPDNLDVVDIAQVPVLLQFNIIKGSLIFCGNNSRKIMTESEIMANYHDYHYYLDYYLQDTLRKIRKGVYFDRRIAYP